MLRVFPPFLLLLLNHGTKLLIVELSIMVCIKCWESFFNLITTSGKWFNITAALFVCHLGWGQVGAHWVKVRETIDFTNTNLTITIVFLKKNTFRMGLNSNHKFKNAHQSRLWLIFDISENQAHNLFSLKIISLNFESRGEKKCPLNFNLES